MKRIFRYISSFRKPVRLCFSPVLWRSWIRFASFDNIRATHICS